MFKAAGFIQLALAPVFVIPAVSGQDDRVGGLEAQLEATKTSLEYIAGLRTRIQDGDGGAVRALMRATESPRALSTVQRASAFEELQDDLAELRYALDRLLADPAELGAIMGLPRTVVETLGLVGAAPAAPGAVQPAPGSGDAAATAAGPPSPATGEAVGSGTVRALPESMLAGTRPTTGLDAHLHRAIQGEVGPLDQVSPSARRRGAEPVPFEGEGFVADPVRLARLLVRTGRTAEVIQLLRAKAESPGERYWLARAYVAQDRIDEALEHLRELASDESAGVFARHAKQDLEFLEFERSMRRKKTSR